MPAKLGMPSKASKLFGWLWSGNGISNDARMLNTNN